MHRSRGQAYADRLYSHECLEANRDICVPRVLLMDSIELRQLVLKASSEIAAKDGGPAAEWTVE